MKHTKGPWVIVAADIWGGDKLVAEIQHSPNRHTSPCIKEARANAELIAKAPEMHDKIAKLEHIVRLARDIEHPDYPDYDWPSGSTEYEARRKRLRDALAP